MWDDCLWQLCHQHRLEDKPDERLARRGNVGKTSEILVTELTFGLAILVYNDL